MHNLTLENYSQLGVSLEKQGISETVFPIEKINSILEELSCNNQSIVLGGDIYIKENGAFNYYGDWFYEGKNVNDSINKAKEYLSLFKTNNLLYVSLILT